MESALAVTAEARADVRRDARFIHPNGSRDGAIFKLRPFRTTRSSGDLFGPARYGPKIAGAVVSPLTVPLYPRPAPVSTACASPGA